MSWRRSWILVSIVITCAICPITGQTQPTHNVGWVGLYNQQLIDWLENVNRMRELCAPAEEGSAAYDACRHAQTVSKTIELRLFAAPTDTALPVGAIRLVATPGTGLAAFFVPGGNRPPRRFQPDLYDSDWGYGPYFHETYLDRRGPWFRLAEGPFPKGSWLDSRELAPEPVVETLEPGDIVTTPRRDLYIIGIDAAAVRARLEQPRDMWCEGGLEPPLKPFRTLVIPFSKLYDATGHLVIHVKYTRGC